MPASRAFRGVTIAATTAVYVASTGMFVRLARGVEGDIAAGRPARRDYAFTNTFSVRDMRESCNEYRRIPGFDDKREAFKRFLIRQGVDPADFRF